MAIIARAGLPYAELITPLIMAGAGISMAMPAAQNAVVSSVGPDDLGSASGAFTMMRQLGGVFGLAIVVTVFAGAGSYVSAQAFATGFGPALGVAAGFSVLGALVSLVLPAKHTAPATIQEPVTETAAA